MSTASRRLADPMTVWALTAAGLAGFVASSAALRPRQIYEQFIWKQFVGPVLADGFGAECVVRSGNRVAYAAGEQCVSAGGQSRAVVARAELTAIGTAGYVLLFCFLTIGGLLLLSRLDLFGSRRLLPTAIPCLCWGGAVLALHDAAGSLPGGPSDAIGYPFNLLLAGPFPVFVLVLGPIALVGVSEALARAGLASSYSRPVLYASLPVFGILVATLALSSADWTVANLVAPLSVVTIATASAVSLWGLLARVRPGLVDGIGSTGLIVTWAYVLTGLTTVVAIDWSDTFGFAAGGSGPPLGQGVTAVTRAALPADVVAVTGAAWPYLLVQIGVALLVAASFDEETVTERPIAMLLLVAVVGGALVSAVETLLVLTFGV
jgi:uncharacterized membrane protein